MVTSPAAPARLILFVTSESDYGPIPKWLEKLTTTTDLVCVCEPRGIGTSQWTRHTPPNYVERSHFLLGRTTDSGRIWDIAAAARYLRAQQKGHPPLMVAGEGASAVLAIYAALLEPEIDGLILSSPVPTHMDPSAPTLLNVLRVCDIPDALGMVAPRPAMLIGPPAGWPQKVGQIYRAANAEQQLSFPQAN